MVGAAICAQTNAVRTAHGRSALTVSARMSHAAHLHAEQMVEHDFFGHTAPATAPWRRPADRLVAAGIISPHTPAENIATWFAMDYQPGDGYRVLDVETFRYRSRGRPLQPHTPESFAQALVICLLGSMLIINRAYCDYMLRTQAPVLVGCTHEDFAGLENGPGQERIRQGCPPREGEGRQSRERCRLRDRHEISPP